MATRPTDVPSLREIVASPAFRAVPSADLSGIVAGVPGRGRACRTDDMIAEARRLGWQVIEDGDGETVQIVPRGDGTQATGAPAT